MDGWQGGRAAVSVRQDLTTSEMPFALHPANAQITTCPVKFLNKAACVATLH